MGGTTTVGTEPSGRLVRRMVTARTKGLLLERMKSARNAADAGLTLVRHDHTVGRFLDEWARDVLPGSVALATEAQYRDVITLLPHAEDRPQTAAHPVGPRRLGDAR